MKKDSQRKVSKFRAVDRLDEGNRARVKVGKKQEDENRFRSLWTDWEGLTVRGDGTMRGKDGTMRGKDKNEQI